VCGNRWAHYVVCFIILKCTTIKGFSVYSVLKEKMQASMGYV